MRTELVPRLAEVRREWQGNYSSDERADDYMEPLKDSFKTLTDEFIGDEEVKNIVDNETRHLDDWITDHTDDEADDRPKRTLGEVETPAEFDDSRSIFDDVDV